MTKSKNEIYFITLLRAVASLLVLYAHLVYQFLEKNSGIWKLNELIKYTILSPFSIIQGFGFLGVCIFFLVSGFIITYVAQHEDRKSFIIKRFFRIYIPLFFSITLLMLTYSENFTASTTEITRRESLNIFEYLKNVTLTNFFFISQNTINPVTWTLIIEVIFYIKCWLFLPMIKQKPKQYLTLVLLFVFLVITISKDYGPHFFLFAASYSYLPLLFIGQILYFLWTKTISLFSFFLFFILSISTFSYGLHKIHTAFLEQGNQYGPTILLALVVFITSMFLSDRIKNTRVIKFFSKISYSLYLYNAVGVFFMYYFIKSQSFFITLTLSSIITIIFATISWFLFERTSQKLARIIIRKYL